MLRLVIISLLLATPAHAEPDTGLRLSGDARMGLVWSDRPDWAGQRETGLRMTNRTRLRFEFTGETDGGMRFGAEVELDSDRERPRPRALTIGE
ncbi:MAG: porin [Natronohydrobacter sp.]|nr:porin [Natronohydrobacter sp.]